MLSATERVAGDLDVAWLTTAARNKALLYTTVAEARRFLATATGTRAEVRSDG